MPAPAKPQCAISINVVLGQAITCAKDRREGWLGRRLAAPNVENDPACLALGAVGGLYGLRWGVEG